jgi:pyridoxal/pyridoxine/pyridoxamine kinase
MISVGASPDSKTDLVFLDPAIGDDGFRLYSVTEVAHLLPESSQDERWRN